MERSDSENHELLHIRMFAKGMSQKNKFLKSNCMSHVKQC